jgi:anthranilate phosphoribosyltransferase
VTSAPAPQRDAITLAIDALAAREDIGADAAAAVLAEIMAGNASEAQIAAFLIALRTKGETVEEIAGLARTMRELAAHVAVTTNDDLLDVVGTGGGRQTFNVSTTAALIAAGAGCTVAKHGNRSATGLSGAADVLEALGARIDLDPASVGRCVEQVGFGFMFAPTHHAATRYVIPVRKQLGVRTIFNVLGPLTNPAGVTRQLTGVADRRYLDAIAGAFAQLGAVHVLVVSSDDGLDELSTCAPSQVVEVRDGRLRSFTVDAAEVGLDRARPEELNGGTPEVNAEIARRILAGERGAPRDVAVLNAGAGVYAAGRADTLEAGVRAAEAAIDAGAAAAVLERYVAFTREAAREASSA